MDNAVSVSFWHKKICVFHIFMPVIPPYREGDLIWLEISKLFADTKYKHATALKLTQFKIAEVNHTLRREYGANGIMDMVEVEIRILKVSK